MADHDSMQPAKQRKAQARAPQHRRREMMSAHLDEDLMLEYERRSIALRTGDQVEIMRGDFAGHEGEILEIDYDEQEIEVDGAVNRSSDGSQVARPIHPSNVRITELDLTDPRRRAKIERKGVTVEEPEPPEPEPEPEAEEDAEAEEAETEVETPAEPAEGAKGPDVAEPPEPEPEIPEEPERATDEVEPDTSEEAAPETRETEPDTTEEAEPEPEDEGAPEEPAGEPQAEPEAETEADAEAEPAEEPEPDEAEDAEADEDTDDTTKEGSS